MFELQGDGDGEEEFISLLLASSRLKFDAEEARLDIQRYF
jgi:hypothetical protein